MNAHCAAHPSHARAVQRGTDFVGRVLKVDAEAAERILLALATRLDRPVCAVADDVVRGEAFPGRPSWL